MSMEQNKPIILLRPTAVEKNSDSVFTVKKDILLPTEENVQKMVDYLNNETNIQELTNHYSPLILYTRSGFLDIHDCEMLAKKIKCNILGAVFLNLLQCYKFSPFEVIGEMGINGKDVDFLSAFYPLLITNITEGNPEKSDSYNRGVLEDLTGVYKIIKTNNVTTSLEKDLQFMVFLKRVYRRAIKKNMPALAHDVKCNLVHTADTTAELNENIKIFREKKYLFEALN